MGWIARIRADARAGTPGPADDFWYQPVGYPSEAGVAVSRTTALTLSAVWRGLDKISRDIGMSPCQLYEYVGTDGAKQRARGNPLYTILRWRPNAWMTAMQFWGLAIVHALLRGNFFAYIGQERYFGDSLVPLDPDRMTMTLTDREAPRYAYRFHNGITETLSPDRVFHLTGLTLDGQSGISFIEYGARSLGIVLATDTFRARFFGGGVTAAVAAIHPGVLGPEGQKNLRQSIQAFGSGLRNAHDVLILEEGMKVEPIGIKPEDAQMIEATQAGIPEVARWLGLDPHWLMDNSGRTNATAEQDAIDHVVNCLQPWAVALEQTIQRDLVLNESRFFAEFLLDGRMRGDLAGRAAYYQSGINAGWLWPNEARRLDNMNPDPVLDDLHRKRLEAGTVGSPAPKGSGPSNPPPAAPSRAEAIVQEAAARLVRKELAVMTKAAAKHAADPKAWGAAVGDFYRDHAIEVARSLRIPVDRARDYCAAQALALCQGGIAVTQTWEWATPPELARLALEDTR